MMTSSRPPVVAFTLRVIEALDLDRIAQVCVHDMVEQFGARHAQVIHKDGELRHAHGLRAPGLVQWRFSLGSEPGLVLELLMDPDPDLPIVRQQYVDLISVVRKAAAHAHSLSQERRDAAIDPLTGVFNRRSLGETMETMFERAEREDGDLAVMIVDLDNFKVINDRHGHAAGDEVLKAAAACLRHHLRGGDHVGRWGGDEFLVVLDGASALAAKPVADRLRQAFAENPVVRGVTMSIGIADRNVLPADRREIAALIEQADSCLYRSKRAGRNRTSIAA